MTEAKSGDSVNFWTDYLWKNFRGPGEYIFTRIKLKTLIKHLIENN